MNSEKVERIIVSAIIENYFQLFLSIQALFYRNVWSFPPLSLGQGIKIGKTNSKVTLERLQRKSVSNVSVERYLQLSFVFWSREKYNREISFENKSKKTLILLVMGSRNSL